METAITFDPGSNDATAKITEYGTSNYYEKLRLRYTSRNFRSNFEMSSQGHGLLFQRSRKKEIQTTANRIETTPCIRRTHNQ
jgi:hypothetical protein